MRTAESVDYLGAGTVEFILSEQKEFFFLEMNTRLQVEHPITEMVTGTDLVRAQIRIARGQGIPYEQAELSQKGWALEFRIYAEDPAKNFMPALGRINSHITPTGPGVRIDSGIYEGFDVPIHYDPLLAKLIVWGEDRLQAIARGRRALQEFTLHGPGHNIPFHLWALERPRFIAGTYTTNFIDNRFDPDEFLDPLPDDDRDALLAAGAVGGAASRGGPHRRDGTVHRSFALAAERPAAHDQGRLIGMWMKKRYILRNGDELFTATVARGRDGELAVQLDDGELRSVDAVWVQNGRALSLRMDGRMHLIDLTGSNRRDGLEATVNGRTLDLTVMDELRALASRASKRPAAAARWPRRFPAWW